MQLFTPLISNAEKAPLKTRTTTGFQSPADDYLENTIDFTKLLITNPPANFVIQVKNEAHITGIHQGDWLVINRARSVSDGVVALMNIDGRFAIHRLLKQGNCWFLSNDEEGCSLIPVKDATIQCMGVVHGVVRILKA